MLFQAVLVRTAAALALLTGSAQAACIVRRQSDNGTSTLPENDPFYHPSGLESLENGAVIASRSVDTVVERLAMQSMANMSIEAHQVSYRTSGPNGEPLSAVTTVWVPTPRQPNLLVAYSSPEDSSNINCAPSYSYLVSTNNTILGSESSGDDAVAILLLLLRGYVVISSDYETNELAAFGIGSLAAHGVLDGIRATLNFNASTLSSTANETKVAIHGYSGGGLASGWATQLQPTYAPEINLVASAFGGLPANLTADGIFLDGTVASGFIPITWAGIMKYYSDFRDYFNSVATEAGQAANLYANTSCVVNVLAKYPLQSFFNGTTYQTHGLNFTANSAFQQAFSAQTLAINASTVPGVPIYATHCATDTIVYPAAADAAYSRWCEQGAKPITYLRDVSGNCTHSSEYIYSIPEYFEFIAQRFAGVEMYTNCSVTNRSLAQPAADALGSNGTVLYGALLASLASST